MARLLGEGAPIDAFGVGTRMTTSEDAPNIDVVYKLVRDDSGPRMKTSTGKATLPDVKQVYRFAADGTPTRDVISLATEEPPPGGAALLEPMLVNGRRTTDPITAEEARSRAIAGAAALPEALRGLGPSTTPFPVEPSAALAALAKQLAASK